LQTILLKIIYLCAETHHKNQWPQFAIKIFKSEKFGRLLNWLKYIMLIRLII